MATRPIRYAASSRLRILACGSLFAFAVLGSGCGGQAPSAQASGTSPSAEVAPGAPGTDRHDITQRDDVEAQVHYPALRAELAPLEQAMHVYADAQKAEIIAQMKKVVPAAERKEKPGRLDLDFTVATQTQDFVSALAVGEGEFGGAHPLPLRATFTQHLPSAKIVALTDLFGDADAAIKIFSTEAIRRFEADFEAKLRSQNLPDKQLTEQIKAMHDMVEQGAAPKAENFPAYLVDGVDGKAIGITLVFPAAQIAPYVDGPQQIEVPVKLFYDAIKPEYRNAFDKEETKPAAPITGSR
jgi:hypothetical protein